MRDTWINNAIVHLVAVTACSENASVCQPLKLVRDSLGFHPDSLSEFCDAQFTGANDRVEET
jgi:hypothetical protein